MSQKQVQRFKKLSEDEALRRFNEIYDKVHPAGSETRVRIKGHIHNWMETYFRIRSNEHAEILDSVALAFGHCVAEKNKQIRALEQIVKAQREELHKLQRDLPTPPCTDEVASGVEGAGEDEKADD